jgi:uncharacterized membrane protein YccC
MTGRSFLAYWRPVWSRPAAIRAVRAAIVVPGLFALCDQVFENLQMATFAAFGGFATLVLVTFSGTRREKLAAHTVLALAGTALVAVGTAANSPAAVAALVTLLVTFLVFFAGVTGPNAAAAVNGALLAYVLPAASPGTVGMIPDRIAGWVLASVAGTAAVLAFSPKPGGGGLRAAASRLAKRLADTIDAALTGIAPEQRLGEALETKHGLLEQFTATPYRPIGLAAPDEALGNGVELLEWCTSLVADMVNERADLRDAQPAQRALLEQSAAALRRAASLLDGGHEATDLGPLERAREKSVEELAELSPEHPNYRPAAQLCFHANMVGLASLAIAADALVAARVVDPDWLDTQRRRWYAGSGAVRRTARRVSSIASAARPHASVRSVWLISSVRGAVALAAAVLVADLSSVQHGFWVVLGTLSVLRTNAGSTGATALRALAGTVAGFVIGGALLVALGSSEVALWVVLPIAVLVAAYAPGTAPFAVGQAAFTVTVAVLYNLIVPVGWKVGVVRIEDVALGCLVSVAVGTLFWPRGLAAVVGDDLADAFRTGASYLTEAVRSVAIPGGGEPDGGAPALRASARLDEALRGFLAEQGSKRVGMQELWRLVGGSLRVRLTAYSIANLPPPDTNLVADARAPLLGRVAALSTWFEQLAQVVGRPTQSAMPALAAPAADGADGELLEGASGTYYGVWLCEHLDHLAEHLGDLVSPALRVAEVRRRPWWR